MSEDLDRLIAQQDLAIVAAERLLEAIRGGGPFDHADLTALTAYDESRAALGTEVGLDATDVTLADIGKRLQVRSTAERLRPLIDATAPDLPQLPALQETAKRALAGAEIPSETLEVLLGIVDLAGPARGDTALHAHLLTHAVHIDEPPGLVQAVSFAAAGQLHLADETTPVAEEEAEEEEEEREAEAEEEEEEPEEEEPEAEEDLAADPAPSPVEAVVHEPAPEQTIAPEGAAQEDTAQPEPAIAEEPDTPDPTASVDDQAVDKTLARLATEHRFGLAMHVANAAGKDEPLALALRLAAIAAPGAFTIGAGSSAIIARETLEELATTGADVSTAARLLTLAGAIPIVRVAPHVGAAQVMQDFRSVISSETALHDFITVVAETASRGILIDHQLLHSVEDVTHRDERIAQLSVDARAKIDHPPSLAYRRASNLLRELVHSDESELGLILDAVASDDVERLEEVRRISEQLVDRSHAIAMLTAATEADRHRTKRKPIVGAAREGFVAAAAEIAQLGGEWARVRSAETRNGDDARLTEASERLGAASKLLLEADASCTTTDPLASAAHRVLSKAAREFAAQLATGSVPPVGASDPIWCLGGELLRDPDIRLDLELTPVEPPSLEQLLRLVGSPDWRRALRARADRGDGPAVERLLEALKSHEIEIPDKIAEVEADARHRLGEAAKSTERLKEDLLADLSARFQRGALSAPDWERLAREADKIENREGASTAARADAYKSLGRQVVETAARHVAEVALELRKRAHDMPATEEQLKRIDQALEDEDVATAEHVVLWLERGEPLPEPPETDDLLARVFPELGQRLADIDAMASDLADQLAATGAIEVLDAPPLDEERRENAASGLRALRDVHLHDDAGCRAVSEVLTLLGIRVDECDVAEKVGRWPAYDVAGAVADKAIVPRFGSTSGGRYRVLVVPASDASEQLITSTLGVVAGRAPAIVLHSRALPTTVRRGIAELAGRLGPDGQALTCDLSVCAAVAALAPRSFKHTARLTLPFTAVNPYDPDMPQVPEEMFYGRRSILQDLTADNGTIAFIYGGRRLGKSALLRAAEREALRRDDLEVTFVDLQDEGIGGPHPPARLAEVLEERFARVLPPSRKHQALARLPERILALKAKRGPRLLALLDEADLMIEADAKADFRVMDVLRRLQEDSDKHIRFVFAGLHSVRRFSDYRNLRLVQFGRSEPIGALEAEPARDLLYKPLEALGYRLDERSINRILTLTQYQPNLIQLVCHNLLHHLHGRTRSVAGPPYPITIDDVEGVLRQRRLRDAITERFDLTTVLDYRYRVIALCAAYLAAERGTSDPFEVRELRDECNLWWAPGFADTSSTEFAALLEEMVGLGLLFRQDRRYGLYSPHIARLIGTETQILDQLEDAGKRTPPKREFDGTAYRPALPPSGRGQAGRLSPLNMRQVARLQARDSGLYVMPVSPALDAQLIPEVLTWHLPKDEGYDVLSGPPGDLNWLVQRMKRSSRDDRVAWIFAGEATTDTLASRLGDARRTLLRRQAGDSSCKAVVVFQPESFTAWRQLAKEDKFEQHGIVVMEVRRHTPDSLGSWSRVKGGVDLPELEAHPSAEKLIRATGGWPMLVDEAVALLRRKPDLGAAIAACEERLAAEPEALVEASGVLADPKTRAFFEAATELGDTNLAVSEGAGFLGELAEMDKDDAQSAWDLLRAIAAIEIDAGGFVRPEPVLADCFRRVAKE